MLPLFLLSAFEHCLSFIILSVTSDLTAAECPLLVLSSAGAEGLSTDLIHNQAVERHPKCFLCCAAPQA